MPGILPYYDTETKDLKVIENSNEHHSHGACQPLKAIAGYDIDVVLTNGMGRRAVSLLNEGGIKVYLLEGDTVEEAIARFEAGELRELTSDMACQGHGCH
ncbi:NifB/NifX family molybdenum-iron cluster-binding protein [Anoxybacter fermentans]|uniref:NifB/NifX family molybdenum-iron cluster-binding protein n=1 Tax=Anoxybacter fermentans TaxID=1323375 RepID=UPI001F23E357|nr:NifB/NifX family molybdenum-iron cluster-binding protein [Anoxybacter fermentans]